MKAVLDLRFEHGPEPLSHHVPHIPIIPFIFLFNENFKLPKTIKPKTIIIKLNIFKEYKSSRQSLYMCTEHPE